MYDLFVMTTFLTCVKYRACIIEKVKFTESGATKFSYRVSPNIVRSRFNQIISLCTKFSFQQQNPVSGVDVRKNPPTNCGGTRSSRISPECSPFGGFPRFTGKESPDINSRYTLENYEWYQAEEVSLPSRPLRGALCLVNRGREWTAKRNTIPRWSLVRLPRGDLQLARSARIFIGCDMRQPCWDLLSRKKLPLRLPSASPATIPTAFLMGARENTRSRHQITWSARLRDVPLDADASYVRLWLVECAMSIVK